MKPTIGKAMSRISIFLTLLFWYTSAKAQSERYSFPSDPHVLDAKRDLGAKGDGMADDTEALQKGIDLSSGYNQRVTKALYLPKGTYKVTKTLVVKNALGPWFYGESRDGVVIKLVDGAAKDVTCVMRTHPNEKGPTSADWFMRNLRHFTIDAANNPHVDGIRYYSTNTGILKDVRVIGNGKVGINAGFLDQSGPNLVQDAIVEGFETGILSQWIWGQSLSRITIKNCRQTGLVVSANVVAVEDLKVENTPQAIYIQEPNKWSHWAGTVALVGGQFNTTGTSALAIKNDGVLFARDIRTTGYPLTIESIGTTTSVQEANVSEFQSHPTKHLFPLAKSKERLPIKTEPVVPWENNPENWVCANDHGAKAGDNQDDTPAIQKAIDHAAKLNKTVVYLRGCGGNDPNWYTLEGEIKIHGSVRMIMGLGWARILRGKSGKFIVSDESAPLVKFQNIDAFGGPPVFLENRSKERTMVVESCGVHILGTGLGDIFATDCPSKVELKHAGQKMWCRQLNPEGDSDVGLVQNEGADLWILGMKCEGKGVRARTSKGGRTEIFGVFNYGPGMEEKDRRPLFEVDNASFRLMGLREINFAGHTWTVKVKEKRANETKELDKTNEGGWIGWSQYDGWLPEKR
jgi:hypothetical protein